MTVVARDSLRSVIGSGLAWSTVNSLLLRLGSFAVGIFLARLLAPEQFGVFAVALTVQAVLITLADLGMSTDLIRSDNAKAEAKAPTVATLALISGATMTAVMAASAQGLADLMGSGQAGPVIGVMAFSLTLAGLGVVPYAALQRRFAQKKLFIIALVEFLVGTALTIALILAGWGVMGLAAARIVSQSVTLILQFRLSGEKVRFGFDPSMAPGILRYGIPVAGANMLSWALLNADNVAISRLAGPVALGFYFLAFNVSNWPMSALGQVVRSISIPAFARLASGRQDKSLAAVMGPVWAVSLLAGLMLTVLAAPLVELIYGEKWLPAAAVLAWLGIFGALRTLFDLGASYLLARGAAHATFLVQVVWLAALVPALLAGVQLAGIAGAAIAHLTIALLVVCPAYALSLRAHGSDLRAVAVRLWPPVAAAVPAGAAAVGMIALQPTALGGLLAGGAAGGAVYSLLLFRWFRQRVREAIAWVPPEDVHPIIDASPGNKRLAKPSGGIT
ncbi:oligosaccharide flippase family protein [Arthrobacter sp. CDRTa11]|nr:oligosaccharide flippase family protein [Arthrobacter sp. CDRTa11]